MEDLQSRNVSVEVIDEDQIGPELDAEIRRLLCRCFPADVKAFSARRAWNDIRPLYSVICRNCDRVVGQVGIIEREITCGSVAVRIAGIQSLAVALDWRKSGASQRLMTTAMVEAKRRRIGFGLLFCVPGLSEFYARLGWQQIERAVTMRDAAGRTVPLAAKNIAMQLSLSGKPFPLGTIDLQGRDW
jgi:predicted N-acetyltransferase YhbS